MTKQFNTYRVEFSAQYGGRPGYEEYNATSKSEAIKQARRYYDTYCKDSDDGRMTYRVVAINDIEVGA